MTAALLTQIEIEQQMYHGGIKRAEGMFQKAEEKGRAVQNPYAREIMQDYVLPLSKALQIELDEKRAGIRKAHARLLFGMDPDAVAFLAVRTVLNGIMMTGESTLRALAYDIGKAVHSELVLVQIEDFAPELYHTLVRDLGRRQSRDERHRMTVFKMQAAQAGMYIQDWPVGARDQVGLYLLGLLEAAGMVEIDPARNNQGKQPPRAVMLSGDILNRIEQIKAHVAVTMPVYGACVEPPMDWVTPSNGGFHTKEMRRTHPALVRHRLGSKALYRDAQMPVVLAAVNTLQRTAWAVNTKVLDTMVEIAKHFSVGEITSLKDLPKPDKPSWLSDADTKEVQESWPEEKKAEFKRWKRRMADWYTEKKLSAVKYVRFYSATRAAQMFREYPALYFVYFADSRGRLYPMTYGVNPQGSDMQKALLRFSKGLPVDTPDAIKWFHVQGANKWGFDKATLAERHAWVVQRQDLFLSFADDPVNNRGWTEASDPLQFLAWCFEYAAWVRDKDGTFVSHLPISMDGSCNGLQNLSALLRDPVGGAATNLTANEQMQDIYKLVATAAAARMCATTYEDPAKAGIQQRWLTNGISRGDVKRSVMTTPYGVTKRSAIDYVIEDRLKKGEVTCFEKQEFMAAASLLMEHAWPAIGDVVVKGRECMEWLTKSARCIVRSFGPDCDQPIITWVSPSGFPACQSYYDVQIHRIHSELAGPMKIRVLSETDDPSVTKHASGLAPNFVHSMDAAHLHLTTAASASRGIDALAMIHDDYGTHAANAELLFNIIREEFVSMYERNDPIQEFKERYPMIPEPPKKGDLDIREVLRSPYFFS